METWIHIQKSVRFIQDIYLTSDKLQHYWWYSVIPDATAASLKVPAEGPQGMVSMSRNENENNSCQSSSSHQWEGWINQHTEPNSPTAKDKSSQSWSCSWCHPEPDLVLSWWLITLTEVHSHSLPHILRSVSPSLHCSHYMWAHYHQHIANDNFLTDPRLWIMVYAQKHHTNVSRNSHYSKKKKVRYILWSLASPWGYFYSLLTFFTLILRALFNEGISIHPSIPIYPLQGHGGLQLIPAAVRHNATSRNLTHFKKKMIWCGKII